MTRREVLQNLWIRANRQPIDANGGISFNIKDIENALTTLAQIEESERLSVEMIERIVKINLPIGLIGKEWPRDVAQAIYQAQEKKREHK